MTPEELAAINQLILDIETLTKQIEALVLSVDNSSFTIKNSANKEVTLYDKADAEFSDITAVWNSYVGKLEEILADKQAEFDAL